jgi:hypothetical protein
VWAKNQAIWWGRVNDSRPSGKLRV